MSKTVYVKNISPETPEEEIRGFFSFCGKIRSLEVNSTREGKEATVTFEKETAAKTALLLDNTKLGATHVKVSCDSGFTDDVEQYTTNVHRENDEITQEEKPRSRIVAEYLSHGYLIGDVGIQRAIDLDHKHGISTKFIQTLQNLDERVKATDKAKAMDQSYNVTPRVQSFFSNLNSFYEKAAGTPTGKKVVDFYTQSSRQVQDIHREARRLADLRAEQAGSAEAAIGIKSNNPGRYTCKGHDFF
jgi:RNA recognition motif-containing protein